MTVELSDLKPRITSIILEEVFLLSVKALNVGGQLLELLHELASLNDLHESMVTPSAALVF